MWSRKALLRAGKPCCGCWDSCSSGDPRLSSRSSEVLLRATKAGSTHSGHTGWVKALPLSAFSESPSELSWVSPGTLWRSQRVIIMEEASSRQKAEGGSRYRSNRPGSPSVVLKSGTLGRTLVSSSATGSASGLQSPWAPQTSVSLPPGACGLYLVWLWFLCPMAGSSAGGHVL